MRCNKYNICNKLPSYLTRNGKRTPCVPKNLETLGILIRIDATPEAGKTITKSHGELIADKWQEVIDEQLTAEEIETAYQAAKSTAEKKRDNWALNIIVAMKVKYPSTPLTAQDISRSSEELAPLLIDQEISDEDSAKLMQVKAAVGASRLPSQLHAIEV